MQIGGAGVEKKEALHLAAKTTYKASQSINQSIDRLHNTDWSVLH
jgi:hypothetical protein